MELAQATKTAIDISTEAELITYRYAGADPREVAIRAELGSTDRPIAGGGNYKFKLYINGVAVMPLSTVSVDVGAGEAFFVSRPIPLETNDLISLTVLGLTADLVVDSTTLIRDVTPAHLSDIVGSGAVAIDHNYGGTDALLIETSDGARIADVSIYAYRNDDYQAGRRDSFYVIGRTTTDSDGRWRVPILLDPGQYILLIYKKNAIATRAVSLTVE